eukprot:CAMPEP_0117419750 /NCGR_PEP_ID=MMETSP0758-20121206/1240_1 /TAXON_ID=63605 /ORGANISM="Percolomonas cosmopolitus, Strain AE-1 (ATCC 50343)" /LENGTH=126 /DNA_ID=CAMNT_0005200983 /DNA_START=221 /DNA_END=601 /DNA_ORIENTATION=-
MTDIVIVDDLICIFQCLKNVCFYIISSPEENELVMEETLMTICESLDALFKSKVYKRSILENYDLLLLILDEIIDDGIIIENDADAVIQRVDKTEQSATSEVDTIQQVANKTKEGLSGLIKSFLDF